MYFEKKKMLLFFLVLILGTVLGTMGTISFPIGTNMSYFWPGAVIQSVAGILFGWYGVIAATIFPSVSDFSLMYHPIARKCTTGAEGDGVY